MHPSVSSPPARDERLENYEAKADIALSFAAVAFLVCYATPILKPDLAPSTAQALQFASRVIWVFFAIDFVLRVYVARAHLRYVRTHLLDLAIVVLPFFQPLRLLRLVVLVRLFNRRAGASLRGKIGMYVVSASVIIIFIAALAVLEVERNAPGSHLDSFPDSVWWAFVTVTTVGYGDIAPVTLTGRAVAVGLMIYGIGLLGTVTGTLASWMVEQIDDQGEERKKRESRAHGETLSEVRALRAEIAELRELVAAGAAPGPGAEGERGR